MIFLTLDKEFGSEIMFKLCRCHSPAVVTDRECDNLLQLSISIIIENLHVFSAI